MLDWRSVRNRTELNNFISEFETLEERQKEEILTEMIVLLKEFKLVESQSDLFMPRQVEKSAPSRVRAKRRRRV